METYRYPEDVDPATAAESTGVVVINTEWGNFGSPGQPVDSEDDSSMQRQREREPFQALDSIRNDVDDFIDFNSLNPGALRVTAAPATPHLSLVARARREIDLS